MPRPNATCVAVDSGTSGNCSNMPEMIATATAVDVYRIEAAGNVGEYEVTSSSNSVSTIEMIR